MVDSFYDEIATVVRSNEKFDSSKMNIIEADSKECKVTYDERKCKTFKIIKEWEKRVM